MKCHQKRRQYDPKQLEKAYYAVANNKMPIQTAAHKFGVPATTLRVRIHGKVPFKAGCLPGFGTSPILDEAEEEGLVDCLLQLQTHGYEHSRKEVMKFATDLVVALGKRSASDSALGLKWFSRFAQRNPKFKIGRASQKLSIERAKCTSREVTDSYYSALNDILVKSQLLEEPERIYVIEEVSFAFEMSPESVYCGSDVPEIVNDEDQVTMIACGNASGSLVPPFFVLPGKRWNKDYLQDACSGSSGECSESGSCNAVILRDYFDTHFKKFVPLGQKNKPKLILFDGYKSLLQLLLKNWAEDNNTLFFVIPPHAAARPELNTGCFNAVNTVYTHECQKYLQRQSTCKCRLTNREVCGIASEAYLKTMTPSTLCAWFNKMGLYPFQKVTF